MNFKVKFMVYTVQKVYIVYKVLTNVKQFGIIQIEKWKPKTVATMIHKQYYEIKSQTCEPYLLQQTAHFSFLLGLKYMQIANKSPTILHTLPTIVKACMYQPPFGIYFPHKKLCTHLTFPLLCGMTRQPSFLTADRLQEW